MTERIFVHIDLNGQTFPVGIIYVTPKTGRYVSTSFAYDESWLDHPLKFSIDPALFLGIGAQHAWQDRELLGAFGDSAPDQWGRQLMQRRERMFAKQENRDIRTLTEIDYLLGVNDEARMGALRFSEDPRGPFLADGVTPIPPLVDLPRLLNAAASIDEDGDDADDDILLLIGPGSSLGGVRPKASVRDKDGSLVIAKFPKAGDSRSIPTWEEIALTLASRAGLNTPAHRIEIMAGRPVNIIRRFDRSGDNRTPYLSAMSMLAMKDGDTGSYLEIMDVISMHSAARAVDGEELWRRIVFSVLISNGDDHPRNHGFLHSGSKDGWRLSPVFDINPVPTDERPRILSTTIDGADGTMDLGLVFEVAEYFGVGNNRAKEIAAEVGSATAGWRELAKQHGIKKAEIERMVSAFEHKDLEQAKG